MYRGFVLFTPNPFLAVRSRLMGTNRDQRDRWSGRSDRGAGGARVAAGRDDREAGHTAGSAGPDVRERGAVSERSDGRRDLFRFRRHAGVVRLRPHAGSGHGSAVSAGGTGLTGPVYIYDYFAGAGQVAVDADSDYAFDLPEGRARGLGEDRKRGPRELRRRGAEFLVAIRFSSAISAVLSVSAIP